MKKSSLILSCLGVVLAAITSQAIDLKQSKVTQVVNDVQIISAADQRQKAAAINDLFSMPDILRTGTASRAELVAQDETVTRVGANTIFSFDPANRTLDLQQGSLLFHSPHGKGGGTIHTGSATASVLGTTLMVTTTPNGGFKVLDLEGTVDLKLRHGRRQKLHAGQMTFILPGTNQLAPIIVFRIDELIRNSLLIKGFTETLESLPLIQDQSALQLKLIQSGKLTDTGLYAGNNASANQVEVLDANTISHGDQGTPKPAPSAPTPPTTPTPPIIPPPTPPNPAAAEAADATINQPSLTDASIPTPPNHVFTGISLTLPNNGVPDDGFNGFVARNIFVNTTGGDALSPLIVNLSPYASLSSFDFVAVNNFSIEGSVTFQDPSVAAGLTLIAGDQFNFTPGISVTAGVLNFYLDSPATMSFNNVSLYNPAGDISLDSAGDVSFQNNSLVNVSGGLSVVTANDISVADSQFNGNTAVFTSLSGAITFDTAVVNAKSQTILTSPMDLSLNNSVINSDSATLTTLLEAPMSINNSTINVSSSLVASAGGELDITGNTESAGVRRSARTVTSGSALNADPATGTVSLSSSSGSVNVSGTSITAHYLTLNSGDGILLDASGQTLTASGSGATATFTAPNLITVNNADFSSFAVVNMAANTIVLDDDVLALISNFGTKTGLANFGGSVIQGELNLFGCTTPQGNPVTSVTYSSGPGSTPGIYSFAKQ